MNERDPSHIISHVMALEHLTVSLVALIAKAISVENGRTDEAIESIVSDAEMELDIARRENGQHAELWSAAQHVLSHYRQRAKWLCDWANQVPGEDDAVN